LIAFNIYSAAMVEPADARRIQGKSDSGANHLSGVADIDSS